MYKVQYFVNLQDLASSFTTKELIRRCFAKTKVISYTTFSEIAEQLLFRNNFPWLLLYVSPHIFTKGRQLPSNHLPAQGQQYKN